MAWVTLHLTSPFMTDASVHRQNPKENGEHWVTYAQSLLKQHSSLLHCDPGTVDGVYGVSSAHATKQAKYYYGYRVCDGKFGEGLLKDLQGSRRRPDQIVRAKIRRAAWAR